MRIESEVTAETPTRKRLSNSGLLGGEGELHLARWYSRPGGWAFSLLEVLNFDTGTDWALLAVVYDKHEGLKVTVCS